ncbi:MAG: glycyl-radical enzyme activating protein, partial [Clostridia bacterium]|nr:glycyl-radical enzyme activating protein [Clostridia bacterium]
DAIVISGKLQTAEEVFAEIMKDAEFYPGSGGGVTFSGGEPLLQAEFCADVARRCREQGIQVLVDTAGCVPFASFEKVIPYCDLFYFDLKASDEADFSAMCGGNFQLVTENLKRLAMATNVVVRMPIIPGHNDNAAYMEAYGQILSDAKANRVDLLPFHRMGSGKYKALGQVYDFDGTKPPDMAQMESLAEILRGCGLDCRIEK